MPDLSVIVDSRSTANVLKKTMRFVLVIERLLSRHLTLRTIQFVGLFRTDSRRVIPLLTSTLRGHSSVGRAVALQAIGQGFDSPCLHVYGSH